MPCSKGTSRCSCSVALWPCEPVWKDCRDCLGSPALFLPCVMLPPLAIRLDITDMFCTLLLIIHGASSPLLWSRPFWYGHTTKLPNPMCTSALLFADGEAHGLFLVGHPRPELVLLTCPHS